MNKTRHPRESGTGLPERLLFLVLGIVLAMSVMSGLAMLNVEERSGYGGRGTTRSFLSADPLIGERVVDPLGGTLGVINDVMIDTHEGSLLYALVSPDGFVGPNDEVIPVPWTAMARNTDRNEFVLNLTANDLRMAPRFQKDKSPDLDDPCWDGDFRKFFENGRIRNQPDDRNLHAPNRNPFASLQ
jgi:sporulation protein YlmC with PRC-barrel domain